MYALRNYITCIIENLAIAFYTCLHKEFINTNYFRKLNGTDVPSCQLFLASLPLTCPKAET